ncbi:MAG: TolC family protein [Deltaproteobacteria bacterium]|nr:MAG: TolC family protein [Deltaproteobacteria bacterium]
MRKIVPIVPEIHVKAEGEMEYQRPFFRRLLLLALCLAGIIHLSTPLLAQNLNGMPPDLQALVAESLKANAEVKQMRSTYKASQETIRSAGALDDPEASFAITNWPTDTWRFNQDEMTQKMFEVSQKIPFPGKLRLRSEVAEEQSRSDKYIYKDKANEVRSKVIIGYWSLSLAYTNFDLTQKNKQFWEQVVKVAETRYSVGQGQQADVLQAQVELGNYLDRLFQWTQKQQSARADLNALRSRPPRTAIPKPQPLNSRPNYLKLDDLLAQAEARPQLQALKALIAKQERSVDLAKKEYYPDFTFGLSYALRQNRGEENRADMVGGKIMINLPIWQESKIKPRIREEEAKQSAAKEGHQSAWNQLAAMIKDRHAKLQRLSQQIALLDQGIIPQARQAAAASLSSYQVGALDFAQLYQSQIAVYSTEIQLQEYLKDFEENWAELEWLVGNELPRRPGGKK